MDIPAGQSIFSYKLDWRYREAIGGGGSKDAVVTGIRKFKKKPNDKSFRIVFDIYDNPLYKRTMETMLLAGCLYSDCASFFGISESDVDLYRKSFFDVEPILGSRARLMAEAMGSSDYEREMKLCAVKFGREVILHLIDSKNEVDEDELKKRIRSGLLVKSLGHELVGSGSEAMDRYLRIIDRSVERPGPKKDSDSGEGSIEKQLKEHFKQFFTTEKI
jgi:hypothetical protein